MVAREGAAESSSELRRTLLVGIGGSGQKVLVQLKAQFMRNHGKVPAQVEFLCFDTDQGAEEVRLNGRRIRLTAETELVNIGGVETAEIIRHLDKYPAIAEWISEDKERFPSRAIVQGAQQVRPLGRLAFFWHIGRIADRIEGAIQRLTDLKLDVDRRNMDVFIVCSVCGGTGSGAFLDMAYLVRHLVQQAGLSSSSVYVNGVLALPSVFHTVDKLGIESNAFASLTELDHLMEEAEWQVPYGSTRVPEVSFAGQRPFNICYLIDARNERGQGLQGLEEIAPMIAEAMYLQISSQVGGAQASTFDNVRALGLTARDGNTGKDFPTAYSSFGTSALTFPARKIIEVCAHRLALQLITTSLLTEETQEERAEAALVDFVQSNQLEHDSLLDALSRDAQGRLMAVALDPRALDRFKDNELMGNLQAYLARAESHLDNEINQSIEQNREHLVEQFREAITETVERLVSDPDFALRNTVRFLDRMNAELVDLRSVLDGERADIETRRDRAQLNLRTAREELANSFGGFPLGRGRRIKAARNRHISMYQNLLQARYEARRREEGIALLAELSTEVQKHRSAIQGLVDRLRFIEAQFQGFVERLTSGDRKGEFVLASEITDEQDINTYYDDRVSRTLTAPMVALLDKAGPLYEWTKLDQSEISERVLDFTRSFFDDIDEISIEQVVLDKSEEVPPRKRLQDLIDRSIPFWMYRMEGVLESDWASEQIVVVGVQEKEHSIYKDAMSVGQQLTSTFDPHKIVVLQTKHGLPFFALTQHKQFKQSHDRVIQRNLKPLYILPAVRPGGQRAKQVFALGAVFGFIFKRGVFYYCVPENPVDAPIRLGQGMSDSLQIFRNDDRLIGQVEQMVNQRTSQHGVKAAAGWIEAFINEPYILEERGGTAGDKEKTKDTSIGRVGSVNYELVLDMRKALQDYVSKVLKG